MNAHNGRPLRVGIVVPYDISERGGGVKHHAFQLAGALREMGDQVTIFGPASEPIDHPHVVGFSGVANVVSNGGDNRMALFVAPWKVRAALRANPVDVLHIHEPIVPSLNYYCAWLSRGTPKVCTFHAFAEAPPAHLRVSQRLWGKTILPFIDRAIAVSEPAARYARIAWSAPIDVIPNGVSAHIFQPGREPRADRPVRLLFVGKLSDPRKGFSYLLGAYRILRARGANVVLDVVGAAGSGDPPPPLEGLTYHGAVDLAELVRRYRTCDVFVAPSTSQESFGIVLIEAMACGRPIVCSDIEGYRQVVHPWGARLVPPRDVRALADAIESIANDTNARRAITVVNRRHAERYAWSRVAPAVREIYLSAIGGDASVPMRTRPPAVAEEPGANLDALSGTDQ